MNIDRLMQYLDFVRERHNVWHRRQHGAPQPWTEDPILAGRKFTNVFRILDPGSQYGLRLMANAASPRDALATAFLYRFTNRPETWEHLREQLGHYPNATDIYEGDVMQLLTDYRDNGGQVFSGAYIVMPEPGVAGVDKTVAVVRKTRVMLAVAADDVLAATTQAARLAALRTVPAVGDFMGMQVLSDFGWYAGHDEDEFVVLGPGSRAGLKDLGWPQTPDSIAEIQRILHAQPSCPRLAMPSGTMRQPSLMDVQNTLCEWSKYVRLLGKPTPKPYHPAHPGLQPTPIYPAHWN